jgi:hypothetical protein
VAGENRIIISIRNFLFAKYYLSDKIEDGYKSKTPGMYGEEEKCIQGFSGDT